MVVTWIFLLFAIVLIALIVAGIGAGLLEAMRGKWWMLGLLVCVPLSFLFLMQVRDQSMPNEVAVASTSAPKKALLKGYSERPTAELWEELTEARIELDESEAAETAQDETKESEKGEKPRETELEEGTPGWLKNLPKPVGSVYRVVVTSDLFYTEDECYDQLEQKFYAELQTCMKRILPNSQWHLIDRQSIEAMDVPLAYVMQNICQDSHIEVVTTSVGPMKKVHVLMEFDNSTQQELREKWVSCQRGLGLATVLKIGTLVLASLVIGFVLLQVDTWTRGYYTKRLLVGVPVAIIAMALLLFA